MTIQCGVCSVIDSPTLDQEVPLVK